MPAEAIPLIAEVDLLVLGGSSGGVAAALAAARAGRRVQVVAPRPYLGEDICARFAYWPAPDSEFACELARQVFSQGGTTAAVPPTPAQVKRTLEQALVQAGVPILLNSHPAALLRDAGGRVVGAVLANRRGRQAILAGQVIDADPEAAACRRLGLAFTAGPQGPTRARVVSLLGTPPTVDGVTVRELPPFLARSRKGDVPVPAYEFRLSVDCGDGSWPALARARSEAMERTWHVGQWLRSEVVELERSDRIAGATHAAGWTGVAAFPVAALEVAPGLHCLGPCAPVAAAAADRLRRPVELMGIGARLGAALPVRPTANPASVQVVCAGSQAVASGRIRTVLDGLRPGDVAVRSVAAPANTLPVLGRYDVVVVGGGTGGAPAAIAAGRAGASTLVCEHQAALGGVGTLGQIANYYYGNRIGFTAEIDKGVAAREPEPLREGWWTPAAKASWYHHECRTAGVVMAFGTTCCGAWVVDGEVRGVVVAGPMGYGLIEAGAVVDASGCADVAAAAGATTTGIGAAHCAVQGTGLAGINPDKRYNNSDHCFSDDTDLADASRFLIEAKEKFRDDFDIGQLIDSRERRQIVGEATLGPVDFLCERRFPDTITIASSNFDTHGFVIHPLFLVKPMEKDRLWVHVPYRCLLPCGLDGILVTGLGISAHRDAVPVVRMQPDVQNHGYAAGWAAATAARQKTGVRSVDVADLQRHLVKKGILPESVLADVDTFPISDARLERALRDAFDRHAGIALCFAEPERSLPQLRRMLRSEDPQRSLRAAQVMALLGHADGVTELRQAVQGQPWDAGWNYTGMGQFGMSTSAMDGLLIALATVGDAGIWPVLLEKITALSDGAGEPEFSHCRAVVVACERLHARHPDARGAAALAALLARAGMSGHAQTTQLEVQAALTAEQNETGVRNVSLRELHLARACWRCGDHVGIAAGILRRYAADLRGHFSRHAKAVLAEPAPTLEPMTIG